MDVAAEHADHAPPVDRPRQPLRPGERDRVQLLDRAGDRRGGRRPERAPRGAPPPPPRQARRLGGVRGPPLRRRCRLGPSAPSPPRPPRRRQPPGGGGESPPAGSARWPAASGRANGPWWRRRSPVRSLVLVGRDRCVDRLVVLNEGHLRAALAEFAAYYNGARP